MATATKAKPIELTAEQRKFLGSQRGGWCSLPNGNYPDYVEQLVHAGYLHYDGIWADAHHWCLTGKARAALKGGRRETIAKRAATGLKKLRTDLEAGKSIEATRLKKVEVNGMTAYLREPVRLRAPKRRTTLKGSQQAAGGRATPMAKKRRKLTAVERRTLAGRFAIHLRSLMDAKSWEVGDLHEQLKRLEVRVEKPAIHAWLRGEALPKATEWNLTTGTTERINSTGVYFNCNRDDAFYERENAVAEIIRRLKEKVRRLENEIAKWESPATADPDERAKAK